MSGVHPESALPETSSKKTDPSRERKKPASPEKRERRRKQVLLAQRAYRARNEANTTALKQHIAHLESALERMSKAVVDFSDILVEEQLLTLHPHVADRLQETLKTCLDSAMYGDEHQQDDGHSQPNKTSPRVQTPPDKKSSPKDDPEKPHLPINSTWRSAYPCSRLLPFELDSASVTEEQVFVEHLRITCLYQGFLMLNNQSIPLEALRRPFRLFLSLVRRQTITSFFYTCLHARLNNKQPEMCKEIPFFKLGGAGTHYSRPVSSKNKAEPRGLEQQHIPVIHGDLSAFSPEAQEELGGEWFDLWDLAGYLRTERITLSVAPPIEKTTYRTVNAVDFTAALVEKGIFLGHSPGFKRSDVETALSSSSWT